MDEIIVPAEAGVEGRRSAGSFPAIRRGQVQTLAKSKWWPQGATLTASDDYFEPETKRPVCLQVIAGPRNQAIRGVSGRRSR
jgi:hypothetical protein